MSASELARSPRLPRDAEGPVFAEPWQAQAFALAVALHARGVFTWREWAQALGEQLAGDADEDGSRYYAHWLAALERLAVERGLAGPQELGAAKAAWAEAFLRTPHGRPVVPPRP